MTYKDYLIDYARSELNEINFDELELGKTILDLLEQSADVTNNDPKVMKQIVSMIDQLLDFKPISPITEKHFVEEKIESGNKSKTILRCTRCHYIYKDEDGKYYNDRAKAFINKNSGIVFYTGQSKQEISLPYVIDIQYEYTN